MRKLIVASWVMALVLAGVSAFAIDAPNSQVQYRTNVTLTSTAPVKLVGASGASVRAITATGSNAQIKVYPSTLTTASSTVTNDMSALKGVFLLSGTSSAVSTWANTELVFSPWGKLGGWNGSIYISSADGTGTVSYIELAR